MQTHASRHVVGEALKDRHPFKGPLMPSDVIPSEIAVAYDRRAIPKLCDVIALPDEELPADQQAHCLRVLLSLLSNQERKNDCVLNGASVSLVRLISKSTAPTVRALAARVVASLSQLLFGRQALVKAEALACLTARLADEVTEVRDEVSLALAALTNARDGDAAARADPCGVVQHCRTCAADGASSLTAKLGAVLTLSHCTRSDDGIVQALEAHVPAAIIPMLNVPTPNSAELYEAVCNCVRNICHHSPYGKVQCLEEGALPALASMLGHREAAVRRQATSALTGLALEEDAKFAVIEVAGARLVKLLHDADVDVAENALMAIHHASELPRAHAMVCDQMSPDELKLAFNIGE